MSKAIGFNSMPRSSQSFPYYHVFLFRIFPALRLGLLPCSGCRVEVTATGIKVLIASFLGYFISVMTERTIRNTSGSAF